MRHSRDSCSRNCLTPLDGHSALTDADVALSYADKPGRLLAAAGLQSCKATRAWLRAIAAHALREFNE